MSNFSAVLSMFVTALSAAVFTRLVGRCAGGFFKMLWSFCEWRDGTARGVLAGQDGEKKRRDREDTHQQRPVHTKVIRLMTVNNEPMECAAVLPP